MYFSKVAVLLYLATFGTAIPLASNDNGIARRGSSDIDSTTGKPITEKKPTKKGNDKVVDKSSEKGTSPILQNGKVTLATYDKFQISEGKKPGTAAKDFLQMFPIDKANFKTLSQDEVKSIKSMHLVASRAETLPGGFNELLGLPNKDQKNDDTSGSPKKPPKKPQKVSHEKARRSEKKSVNKNNEDKPKGDAALECGLTKNKVLRFGLELMILDISEAQGKSKADYQSKSAEVKKKFEDQVTKDKQSKASVCKGVKPQNVDDVSDTGTGTGTGTGNTHTKSKEKPKPQVTKDKPPKENDGKGSGTGGGNDD